MYTTSRDNWILRTSKRNQAEPNPTTLYSQRRRRSAFRILKLQQPIHVREKESLVHVDDIQNASFIH